MENLESKLTGKIASLEAEKHKINNQIAILEQDLSKERQKLEGLENAIRVLRDVYSFESKEDSGSLIPSNQDIVDVAYEIIVIQNRKLERVRAIAAALRNKKFNIEHTNIEKVLIGSNKFKRIDGIWCYTEENNNE